MTASPINTGLKLSEGFKTLLTHPSLT